MRYSLRSNYMQSLNIRYHTNHYVNYFSFETNIFDIFLIHFNFSYLYQIFCIVFVSLIILCIETMVNCRLNSYFDNQNLMSFTFSCAKSYINMYLSYEVPFIIYLATKINTGLHLYYNHHNFLHFNKVYGNIFLLFMVIINMFIMRSIFSYIAQMNAILILLNNATLLLSIKYIYVWKNNLLVTHTSLNYYRRE